VQKETILYERLEGSNVRCAVCLRRCRVRDGERGFCLTRTNRGGRLYSTIYGEVAALHVAPIEMKPVYHYLPGSSALSLGATGCNFLCPGCQNWELSFALEEKGAPLPGRARRHARGLQGGAGLRPAALPRPGPVNPPGPSFLSPEESVREALRLGCRGISWTYNEPTLWLEYTVDSARCAKEQVSGIGAEDRLYTNYVTNGAMTPEALDALGPYLDVFRVDLKGFSRRTYVRIARFPHWEGVLANAKRARFRWRMHVELVTNVIPGVNDDEKELLDLIRWIRDEMGPDTPWHVTRFFPRWRMRDAPRTPVETLLEIRERARAEGLSYVYVGNVPERLAGRTTGNGSVQETTDTFCPGCGRALIVRRPGSVRDLLVDGRCPGCGVPVPGRFA
jgi:pyruvate formate lyase activating enzyme